MWQFHTSCCVKSPSWISIIKSAVRQTIKGDDRINPKKLLERKYLYFSLLATHFRSLRQGDTSDSNCDANANDVLYERATEELDKKGLDQMSNVDLRVEIQSTLQPQVNEIFEAFRRVDGRLGISVERVDESNNDNRILDVDWGSSEYMNILLEEFDRTKEDLRAVTAEKYSRSSSSIDFLTTKRAAIELVLNFHGWSARMDQGALNYQHDSGGTSLDAFGMDNTNTNDSTLRQIRQYQTMNLCRSALLREELGYSILSLRSNIPGGGRGLFIDGSALAGSIVAFQPGDIWPKEHLLTDAPDVMAHFEGEDDCQISLRFDEYLVDSRQSPVTVLTREGFFNPWALGNIANHPSTPTLPNCQSTMLNYTTKMRLGELMKYVPNTYARVPSWKSKFFDIEEVVMHGLCLISRRDVSNEELVYDYRLQSDETPEWYSVVKYGDGFEEDQVVFFRDDWRNDQ